MIFAHRAEHDTMKRLLSICLLLAGSTLFAQEKTDSLRVVTESNPTEVEEPAVLLQQAAGIPGIRLIAPN